MGTRCRVPVRSSGGAGRSLARAWNARYPLFGASLLLGVDPNEFDLSASGDYLTFRLLVIAL